MFCKHCGKYLDEDSIFCKYCGTSQAVMTSVGVVNKVNGRSGVLEIPSNITVDNFVSMLFAKGWIPNNAFTVSTLKITPVKDEDYVMYSSSGSSSQNKESLTETLAEHNSDDVFIYYEEKKNVIFDDDDYYARRPYRGSNVCLYGCPSSEKIEITCETGENYGEVESSIF